MTVIYLLFNIKMHANLVPINDNKIIKLQKLQKCKKYRKNTEKY